jgi:hypothetical protein
MLFLVAARLQLTTAMSRTKHALPSHYLHHMRVQNRRKAEEAALDELTEEDVAPIRHINRLQSFWTQIPEPWNDKPNASGREYHNKAYWVKWRKAANNPHWTKGR